MRSVIIGLITASMVIGGLAGAVDAELPLRAPWARSELSPREREMLKQRYERFKSLPPEKQEQIRARFRQFVRLSPEKREALRWRLEAFRNLTPEERERLRKLHERWRRMPPERRERIRSRLRQRFMKMPDRELADFFHKLHVWKTLPDEQKLELYRRYMQMHRQHRPGHQGGRFEGRRDRSGDREHGEEK